jgi:hypothetical protein
MMHPRRQRKWASGGVLSASNPRALFDKCHSRDVLDDDVYNLGPLTVVPSRPANTIAWPAHWGTRLRRLGSRDCQSGALARPLAGVEKWCDSMSWLGRSDKNRRQEPIGTATESVERLRCLDWWRGDRRFHLERPAIPRGRVMLAT